MTERTIKDILLTTEQQESIRRRLRDLRAVRDAALARAAECNAEAERLDGVIREEQELAARFGVGRPPAPHFERASRSINVAELMPQSYQLAQADDSRWTYEYGGVRGDDAFESPVRAMVAAWSRLYTDAAGRADVRLVKLQLITARARSLRGIDNVQVRQLVDFIERTASEE